MGKSQETRRKLTLAYRRLSPLAQSPLSDRRERQRSVGGSPHFGLFPADKDHPTDELYPQDAPQLATGFFVRATAQYLLL